MDFGFLSKLRWGLTAGASRWGEGSIKGISSPLLKVPSFYLRSREVEALGKVGIASLQKAGDPSLLLSKFILSVTHRCIYQTSIGCLELVRDCAPSEGLRSLVA